MGKQMQPIRSLETVNRITRTLSLLDDERGRRVFMLWLVGIGMGMRIGDMVDLKVGDLRGQKAYTYTPHKQRHKKGVHPITLPVPATLRQAVESRYKDAADGDWLFPSRKKNATRTKTPDNPMQRDAKKRERVNPGAIGRQTARLEIKEIARLCGINEPIGCHTLRKTFGYHYYQRHHNIAILQEWFYHESPATTLVYIGVTFDNFQDMVDDSPFSMDGVRL